MTGCKKWTRIINDVFASLSTGVTLAGVSDLTSRWNETFVPTYKILTARNNENNQRSVCEHYINWSGIRGSVRTGVRMHGIAYSPSRSDPAISQE